MNKSVNIMDETNLKMIAAMIKDNLPDQAEFFIGICDGKKIFIASNTRKEHLPKAMTHCLELVKTNKVDFYET